MCGITGFIDFASQSAESDLIRMSGALIHRGPDDEGISLFQTPFCQVGLGFRRLSILDLSKRGHQPMSLDHGLTIVFNGEIYNFQEIKSELKDLGYTFHSGTDTEVILKGFDQWGTDLCHRLNGMFAFFIYDPVKMKCYLFRDRAGIKPVYYYWHEGLFLFSSELKSFHQHKRFQKKISISAIRLYLKYGYVPTPYSIFEYTYKLEPGHYLEIDLSSRIIQKHSYWNVFDCYAKPRLQISEQEAIAHTRELLSSSCAYRMIADVPVGVFLSGGYDSTAVTALLQHNRTEKIKTFTIGFYEQPYNEAHFAKQVASYLGTDHTEYYCTISDAAKVIPLLPQIYDEPFGDSSAIPTYLVSSLARQQVKVALSADAGDEVFAGYRRYEAAIRFNRIFSRIPKFFRRLGYHIMDRIHVEHFSMLHKIYHFQNRYNKLKSWLVADTPSSMLDILVSRFSEDEINQLVLPDGANHIAYSLCSFQDILNNPHFDLLSSFLSLDYRTYLLDDILTKVDRATMAVSLEGREPLLDYRLIEFVAQLPEHFKFRNGEKKWLLKQIVHQLVPRHLVNRPKMGFGIPVETWLRNDLKQYVDYYFSHGALVSQGIFHETAIRKLLDRYYSGYETDGHKIWFLLIFQMWYEKWGS